MTSTNELEGGIWVFDQISLPEDWKFDRLGNRCTVRRGASPRPAGHPKYFGGGKIPWIKIGDATRTGGRFIERTEEHVNEEGAAHSVHIPAGSLIVANSGVSLGFAAFTRMDGCIHDGWLLLTDFRELDPEYVYYCVNIATQKIRQFADGTTQPNLNTDIARRLVLPLPPLAEQRRIVEALSCLDTKIELNRRMDETLEAMARAIFKTWFVDFGPTRAKAEGRQPPGLSAEIAALFPDALDDEDKPAGWRTEAISEMLSLSRVTVCPQDYPDEIFNHYSIPAYDNAQSPAQDAGQTILSNKTLVPNGAILLSKLNPEIQRVWLVENALSGRDICSTEFLVLEPKSNFYRPFLYLLLQEASFRERLAGMVTGTSKSHQRVSPESVLKSEIASPSKPLIRAFANITEPMLKRVLANRTESRTLAQLRDLLLPKLMSGEIRLKEAEQAIEAVL